MCMTLTLNSEISDRRYQNDLTDEDINIIYSALLNYGKNIADRHRMSRTEQAALRRTYKLAEVFRMCGGERYAVYNTR